MQKSSLYGPWARPRSKFGLYSMLLPQTLKARAMRLYPSRATWRTPTLKAQRFSKNNYMRVSHKLRVPTIMENQMEKNMETEMETGFI